MREIRTRHLMSLKLQVEPPQVVGPAPGGDRRIALIAGGSFHGDRLQGTVMPGGADWIIVRPDACMLFDVRLVLRTMDGSLIGMTYKGLRHGPAEVMERLGRGDHVDPAEYYFRVAIQFETAASDYTWLNSIVALGSGVRPPAGPEYEVHEVL